MIKYININYDLIKQYGLIKGAIISLVKGANNEWAFGITYLARVLNITRACAYNNINELIKQGVIFKNKIGNYCLVTKKKKESDLLITFEKVMEKIKK